MDSLGSLGWSYHIRTSIYNPNPTGTFLTHIPQPLYFIFDLSNSKPKFMNFRQYFIKYSRKFHKFILKIAKFESKTGGCGMWVLRKGSILNNPSFGLIACESAIFLPYLYLKIVPSATNKENLIANLC